MEDSELTTLKLSPIALEYVENIMSLTGLSLAEAIEKSILDELFILEQINNGLEFYVSKNDEFKKVLWAEK